MTLAIKLSAKPKEREIRAGCCRCFIIKIGRGDAPCAPIYSVKASGLDWWWTMYAREDEGGGTIKSFHYLN